MRSLSKLMGEAVHVLNADSVPSLTATLRAKRNSRPVANTTTSLSAAVVAAVTRGPWNCSPTCERFVVSADQTRARVRRLNRGR
jgi:hypothetical protein